MTHLQEITLGDPRYGVRMECGLVLRTEGRFKMIKVPKGLLLKNGKEEFLIEKVDGERAIIRLWDQPFIFRPPQIHLLRALLKMNCSCSTCYRKAHPPTRAV